jgi:hypothetical protein
MSFNYEEDKSVSITRNWESISNRSLISIPLHYPIYVDFFKRELSEIPGIIVGFETKRKKYFHPSGKNIEEDVVTFWRVVMPYRINDWNSQHDIEKKKEFELQIKFENIIVDYIKIHQKK